MGEDKVDFYGIGLLTCCVIPVGAVLLVIGLIASKVYGCYSRMQK